MIGEISKEGFLQLACRLRLRLGFGEVNDDSYGAVGGEFAGPTDDEFLRFLSRSRSRNGNGSNV